ncbi:MAG: cytochrome c3 family protein [Phycisphaerales bacterium]
MSDHRPLSERFDLTYIRARHGADKLIVPLSFIAVVAIGGAVAFNGIQRDDRMYSSGDLTLAHDMFASDCSRCHQQDPDRSNFWLPARDEACVSCHDNTTHSRHGSAHPGGEMRFFDDEHALSRDCAACHVEHQGNGFDLTRVPDMQCTLCHSDLDTAGRIPGGRKLTRPVYKSITSFSENHPEWHVHTAAIQDPGTIRLNHKLHVVDEGMDCQACHTLDKSGRYIEPITFDAHCRSCHEADLGVIDPAKGLVDAIPSPHGSIDLLQETIRERLAMAAAITGATPRTEEPEAEAEDDGSSRRRRGRRGESEAPPGPSVPTFSDPQSYNTWVVETTRTTLARLDVSCAKCHTTERTGTGFEVAPAKITPLWLSRSVFSHSAHIMVRCDECHPGGVTSTSTSDVLLPGIDSCRICHVPSVGAPSDCVTCHWYHDHSEGLRPGDRLVNDLLSPR